MPRVVCLTAAVSPLALAALGARPALAHGFEGRYALPVPLWLYLYGAAAAVLLSFVLVGLFAGREGASRGYPRFDLLRIGFFRRVLAGRPVLLGLRLLSAALFLLVILSGLFGEQSPGYNFAPTFVWVIWWVGLSFFTALVGNLWALVNPWKILFEWADGLARRLGVEDGLELREPYPESWGIWPALALLFIFVWIELVSESSAAPFNIAVLTLLYSALTWSGMAIFGKDVWLRNGEAFSVFFGILARFAPTEVRVSGPESCEECGDTEDRVNCYACFERAAPEHRELNLRPPAIGLARPENPRADRLAFVVFMLASVTYDGLMATPLWAGLQSVPAAGTVGLIVVPLLLLALYVGFVWVSRLLGGGPGLERLAAAYAYSLVPIAFAYQVAHYYTFLLIQGQMILVHLSDPFGRGWDLFGTAGYQIDTTIVGAAFVWYSQVALVVGGHVIAVYLAHLISLRYARSPGLALRSQYPILVLMILYTVSSLWILSQPIIEEETAATQERAAIERRAPA
jgi:hypothetical protein